MKHAIVAACATLAALAWAPAGRAADLPCGAAEKGTVEIDGLTDDWKGVDGIDAGGQDPNLSFTVKCNLEPQHLLLLIDVRDNYFVRTAQAKPGEDHLVLTLAGRTIALWPGNAAEIKDKVVPPWKGLKLVSALQSHGWAVELAVPLNALPGFRPGQSTLKYRLRVDDSDSKAALKIERSVDTSGRIVFAEGQDHLESFLKDRGLRPGDVFFDRAIRVGRKEGGRVVLAGRFAAAIGDGYTYVELPFKDRHDLKDARIVDLAGDGRDALAIRYLERGGGGARELIAAYRFDGDNVRRVFAAEVGKFQGTSKIEDKVAFVRRGRATDIVIEAGAAVGFTQATYQEAPADDVIPVLLPWGDEKRARYQFSGDEYVRK
jgi:hypothetical protein